jgi:hypothetical protein
VCFVIHSFNRSLTAVQLQDGDARQNENHFNADNSAPECLDRRWQTFSGIGGDKIMSL